MIIGVDFDNTIVCYDQIFHQVALKRGLIPSDLPVSKSSVRDHLRQCGKENIWTEMQGQVYGAYMEEVQPYPGVEDFFLNCRKRDISVFIISHKTLYPFEGPKYNLHESAHRWLEKYGFYDPLKIGILKNQVYFDLTKQEKLMRISQLSCTHFIDDLPEFLSDVSFPNGVNRILFDPNQLYASETSFSRAESWDEIQRIIFKNNSTR